MGVKASKIGGTKFFTKTSTPVTTTLPASGGTPLEVDCTGDTVLAINFVTDSDFKWTIAETSALAIANFAASAYFELDSGGPYELTVSKNSEKIYFEAQGAGAGSISYVLSEAD